MKIHFCDLCNESVPQAALDSGAARTVKGRVICAACDAAMSHGSAPAVLGSAAGTGPAQPGAGGARTAPTLARAAARGTAVPPAGSGWEASVASAPPASDAGASARPGAGIAWVAGIAIGFTALSIFVTDDRLERVDRAQATLEEAIAKRDDALRAIATDLNKVHPALAGVETRAVERHDALAASAAAADREQSQAVAALRAELAGLTAGLETLARELEAVRRRVDEPGLDIALEKRLDELSARIAKADDERRHLTERLGAVQALTAAAPAAAAEAPAPEAAWVRFLPDLKHADEGVRWDAVSVLGDANDPAVVPHVVPMLKDPSFIVRMAAARVLGEKLRAREAVPALIEALEDADSAVRESAWIALRAITGKDLKFDSNASEAERSKRAKAWSEWWKKEGAPAEPPKPPAGA
ncbi:MAG: HEAT repeat domain-containing protein [Planctomycetes bacterium]|nr:HEAT repeat domain-containing protein [Planctomycetota bacterium]